MNKVINTEKAPKAIGPYSQAIKAGNGMLFISGQIPVNPETGKVEEGIIAQTEQVFQNIKAILDQANAKMINVVKTTVLLKNIADFAAMNEVYSTYFTGDCPARAAYQVAELPKNALVEIEAIAVL